MALPSAGPTDCSSGLSQRIFNNLRYDNPWQASQSGVVVGTLCCPTVPAGIGFKCTAITTGITGGSEPTWPTILTNTVVDGGVTWTAQDVANPSGKAHSVNFGYLFTSSDLDGFRLLAYNTARAVADEISVGDYLVAEYTTTAAQSIPNAAFTVVNFDTKVVDSANAVTTGAAWKFTCPTGMGGRFRIAAGVAFGAIATTTDQMVSIYKNGAENKSGVAILSATGTCLFHVSGDVALADTDTAAIVVYQSSGAARALQANAARCWFTIHRILGS